MRARQRGGAFYVFSIAASVMWGCGDDSNPGVGGGGASAQGSTANSAHASSVSGSGMASTSASASGGAGGAGGGPPTASLVLLEPGLAVDLTPDGHTALVQDLATLTGDLYLYDVGADTLTLTTSLGDSTQDLATGLAQTGRISALHAVPVEAGVFTQPGGWVDIASPFPVACDINVAGAWDVSADGSVVVGFAWNACAPQAFRWTDDGGAGTLALLDVLGTSSGTAPATNRATVVSDDGLVAGGFAENGPVDRSPAVWNADGSGFLLDPDDMETPGEILSIDADGSVVAGIWGTEAFSWTEANGRVDLGKVPSALPSDPCYPNAMTADGSLIFGGCGDAFFSVPVAFVWKDGSGARSLEEIAAANGVTVPDGFTLNSVLAASADGSVLLGVATDQTNQQKSFVLQLPVSAY